MTSSLSHVEIVLFDLDGTLYEDVDIYDRYADHLADFIAPDQRDQFLAEWQAAKEGRSRARIGLGYDLHSDRLYEHQGGRITRVVPWEGEDEPLPAHLRQGDIFGDGRLNIGDWWGLPNALAAHFGVSHADRERAFLATRDHMSQPDYVLHPEPGLIETLDLLRARGYRIMAMSNSPVSSVDDVFDRLGIRDHFDLIIADARKPAGLERYLGETREPARYFSVGDNYVNDIAPALAAGACALYIDRHDTGMGAGESRLFRVPSTPAMPGWLAAHLPNRDPLHARG